MAEPTVLIEQVSPFGDKQVVVESDNRVTYCYLFGQDPDVFPMKSCWVSNHAPAPKELDVEAMKQGTPPMLPAEYCLHPDGRGELNADGLRAVWLETGDGVAVFENDNLLAVIPPWSGYKGFNGYALDCKSDSPLCWALDGAEAIFDRVRRADKFWQSWDDEGNNPWALTQDPMLAAAEKAIGKHNNYYSIDGGNWPPKALIRINLPERIVLLTIGVSICEQPKVEMDVEDPTPHKRIELGAVLPATTPDDEVKQFGSYISAQSSLPWTNNTWLGHGHTVGCDAMPHFTSDKDTVLLVSETQPFPSYKPVAFNGEPIAVLWMMPITDSERKLAEENSSARLIEKLDVSLMDAFLPRSSVT